MKEKLITLLAKWSLGPTVAAALTVLNLIANAIERKPIDPKSIDNVALSVFKQLPAKWRAPQGPASEVELLNMVHTGEQFFHAVRALLVR